MSSPIIIKYWPILARGRGLFQMCAEAGVPFEHDTDMKGFGAALFGAESTNLAPPIIIDGDDGSVHLRPQSDIEQAFAEKVKFRARRQELYRSLRNRPAVTRDGQTISLFMNAGLAVDTSS